MFFILSKLNKKEKTSTRENKNSTKQLLSFIDLINLISFKYIKTIIIIRIRIKKILAKETIGGNIVITNHFNHSFIFQWVDSKLKLFFTYDPNIFPLEFPTHFAIISYQSISHIINIRIYSFTIKETIGVNIAITTHPLVGNYVDNRNKDFT